MGRTTTFSTSRRGAGVLRWFALLALVLSLIPSFGSGVLAQEDGGATLTVRSTFADGETPLPFVRFAVIDQAGNALPGRETAPPDAETTFTVPAGQELTVVADTPPACADFPADQVVGPLEEGEEADISFSFSFFAECDLGAISLYNYDCPDDIDADITEYGAFRDNCTDPIDDLSYLITQESTGQEWEIVSGAYGIPGRAPLVGLLPDTYLVERGDDNDGSALVFCLTYPGTPEDGMEPSEVLLMRPTAAGELVIDLSGDRVVCDIFQFEGGPPANTGDEGDDEGEENEADDGSEEGGEAEGDARGYIEFHVVTCPTNYEGENYFADCHGNGTDGVTMTVEGQETGATGATGSETSVVRDTPGPGYAVISGLPADTYSMTDDLDGDVELFVYCSDAAVDDAPRLPTPENDEGGFDLELPGAVDVVCDWYITPIETSEASVLRLTKYTCEAGYDGTSFEELTADCTEPTSGVRFVLTGEGGYEDDRTTNGDGKIRFPDLGPDDYVLTEDLPGDALQGRFAFCAVDDGFYVEYRVRDEGWIPLETIGEGQAVQCLWFNVPEPQEPAEPGSLRIHMAECPLGTRENFYDTCYEDVVGGIPFEIAGPEGYEDDGVTSNLGIVTFTELTPGDYTVTQLPKAGFEVALYVVVCSRDGEFFEIEYDDSTGLRAIVEVAEGSTVVCDWYAVPPGDPPTPTPMPTSTPTPSPTATPDTDGGSITIIVSLCLMEAEEVTDFEADCDSYGEGAEFRLTAVNGGGSLLGTTTSAGTVVFSNLDDGAYALEETTDDWCKAQSEKVDASGNVLVENGANTNVYIYNCDPDGKNPVILPNTGTGSTSSGQGPRDGGRSGSAPPTVAVLPPM